MEKIIRSVLEENEMGNLFLEIFDSETGSQFEKCVKALSLTSNYLKDKQQERLKVLNGSPVENKTLEIMFGKNEEGAFLETLIQIIFQELLSEDEARVFMKLCFAKGNERLKYVLVRLMELTNKYIVDESSVYLFLGPVMSNDKKRSYAILNNIWDKRDPFSVSPKELIYKKIIQAKDERNLSTITLADVTSEEQEEALNLTIYLLGFILASASKSESKKAAQNIIYVDAPIKRRLSTSNKLS